MFRSKKVIDIKTAFIISSIELYNPDENNSIQNLFIKILIQNWACSLKI